MEAYQGSFEHEAYLDIVPSMVVAAFSEQPMGNDMMHIQLVEHGIGILSAFLSSARHPIISRETKTNLAQTRREDDDLVNLAHLLQEVINAWSLDNVDVMPVVLNFDGHDIVRLLNGLRDITSIKVPPDLGTNLTYLKAAVHQCLVEIEHETFSSSMFGRYWGE